MIANAAIDVLLPAMKLAGEAILQLQEKKMSFMIKVNKDIVTAADLRANEILNLQLHNAFPEFAWLSEECVDNKSRLQCDYVWIVDPIDGTREYAANIPEYAISVALVEKGIPIAAAIYNPATDQLFHAIKGEGAWLNNTKIVCHTKTTQERAVLLASRSEYKRGEWKRFERDYDVKQVGSIAYKLGLVAAGQADATFSLKPKNEWDIAAGVLLVEEAKGTVTNKLREKFLFNCENTLVNGIVAVAPALADQLFESISC